MNVKSVLQNDKICDYLEVDRFSSTGQFEGCYCRKFYKYLPNATAAMMYCCTYGISYNCWFAIAGN